MAGKLKAPVWLTQQNQTAVSSLQEPEKGKESSSSSKTRRKKSISSSRKSALGVEEKGSKRKSSASTEKKGEDSTLGVEEKGSKRKNATTPEKKVEEIDRKSLAINHDSNPKVEIEVSTVPSPKTSPKPESGSVSPSTGDESDASEPLTSPKESSRSNSKSHTKTRKKKRNSSHHREKSDDDKDNISLPAPERRERAFSTDGLPPNTFVQPKDDSLTRTASTGRGRVGSGEEEKPVAASPASTPTEVDHSNSRAEPVAAAPLSTRAKELERYNEELTSRADALCERILYIIENREKITGPEMQLLEANVAELQTFCVVQRPKKKSARPEKHVEATAKERQSKAGILAMLEQYPRSYYDSLNLPQSRVRQNVPEDLDTQQTKRWHIFNELMQTENDYVRDLGVLVGNEFSSVLETYDFQSIFKNVEVLFTINVELLALLVVEEKKPMKEQRIGPTFLKMIPKFEKYNVYNANHQAAIEKLNLILKDNDTFAAIARAVHAMPESRHQTIDSFLIKPFQRITRYPLLLKELRGATPDDWPDKEELSKAMSELGVVVKGANEAKRETDRLFEIMELQGRFVVSPGDWQLQSLHKFSFVREGVVREMDSKGKLKKPVHLALFTEILIIARIKGKKLYKKAICGAGQMKVTSVPEDSGSKGRVYAICIEHEKDKHRVAFSSPEEKSSWLKAVLEAVKANKTKTPVSDDD